MLPDLRQEVHDAARRARVASRALTSLSTAAKNNVLNAAADALLAHVDTVLEANAEDLAVARAAGRRDARFFDWSIPCGKMVGGTFARTNGMAHDVFRSVRRPVERRSGPGRPASENGGPAVWTVRRFSRGYDGRRPSGRCDGGSVAQVR